eukprot:4474267-Pleurochrysis_carterae.AAC.1
MVGQQASMGSCHLHGLLESACHGAQLYGLSAVHCWKRPRCPELAVGITTEPRMRPVLASANMCCEATPASKLQVWRSAGSDCTTTSSEMM